MVHEVSIQIQLDQDAQATREADQLEKTITWDEAVEVAGHAAAVIDQPGLEPDPQHPDTIQYTPSKLVLEMVAAIGLEDTIPEWRDLIVLAMGIDGPSPYEKRFEKYALGWKQNHPKCTVEKLQEKFFKEFSDLRNIAQTRARIARKRDKLMQILGEEQK